MKYWPRVIDLSSHHRHQLMLEAKETPFECDGCREPGCGTRYVCRNRCDFDLHKGCAVPGDIIIHPFFPTCEFKFAQVAPADTANWSCIACGGGINGFAYHCFYRGYIGRLHPSCANLPSVLKAGGWTLRLHKNLSVKCDKCGHCKTKYGYYTWGYVSECASFHFHVACVKEILLQKWESKLGGSGVRSGGVKEESNLALVRRTPNYLGTVTDQKGSRRRYESSGGGGAINLALVIRNPDLQIVIDNGGSSRRGESSGGDQGENLRIVIDKGKRKTGKLEKFLKISKFLLSAVMAVLVGNPVPLAANLANLISG